MEMTDKDKDLLVRYTRMCRDNFPLFCEKMLGIKLNKGQLRVASEVAKQFFPVNLIITGNRFGKTTKIACKHIWKAYYKKCGPGINLTDEDWKHLEYKTFNVAPHSELTKIMIEMILKICRGEYPITDPATGKIRTNDSLIAFFVDNTGLNNYGDKIPDAGPFSIQYSNRAITRFFTLGLTHGDNVQGRGYGYGSYDEFGRSRNAEKEVGDLIPRLQDYNGELDIITTPDLENESTIGYLLEKKEMADTLGFDSGWRFLSGQQTENEFLSKADSARRMAGLSEAQKSQIMLGAISLVGANYFDIENVNKVFDPNLVYQKMPFKFNKYSVGLDTSGAGKDYWALTIIDYTTKPFKVVQTYYDKFKQPDTNIAITMNILEEYQKVLGVDNYLFTMDKTNEAGSIYYRYFYEYGVRGYRFGIEKGTGRSTKADLLDTLRRAINTGYIVCPPNKMLKNQLFTYKGPTEDDKQVTDALMSLALAVYYPYKDIEHEGEEGSTVVSID